MPGGGGKLAKLKGGIIMGGALALRRGRNAGAARVGIGGGVPDTHPGGRAGGTPGASG